MARSEKPLPGSDSRSKRGQPSLPNRCFPSVASRSKAIAQRDQAQFTNVLHFREQFHQSRLVESVIAADSQYQRTLVTDYFATHGSSLIQAK